MVTRIFKKIIEKKEVETGEHVHDVLTAKEILPARRRCRIDRHFV